MLKTKWPSLLHQLVTAKRYLKWRRTKHLHESVYFYTFHKCASSLFSEYVLKNVEGLRNVDYASRIYSGRMANNAVFEKTGFIYGPLRLSLMPSSPAYNMLGTVTKPEFVTDKIAIFLLRDPRDILVSAYYSFGYTHNLSPVREIREMQQEIRRDIQTKSIDQYCIDTAPRILNGFETLHKLSHACNRSVILRYEDMIDDWDLFAESLTQYIDIRKNILSRIHEKSRPVEKEDKASHRRDGRPGGFRSKLQENTINTLNIMFMSVLDKYKYNT